MGWTKKIKNFSFAPPKTTLGKDTKQYSVIRIYVILTILNSTLDTYIVNLRRFSYWIYFLCITSTEKHGN